MSAATQQFSTVLTLDLEQLLSSGLHNTRIQAAIERDISDAVESLRTAMLDWAAAQLGEFPSV